MVLRITAGGGERFALVLDFNLLPRPAPPKKSMEESDLNPLECSSFRRQTTLLNANVRAAPDFNHAVIVRETLPLRRATCRILSACRCNASTGRHGAIRSIEGKRRNRRILSACGRSGARQARMRRVAP